MKAVQDLKEDKERCIKVLVNVLEGHNKICEEYREQIDKLKEQNKKLLQTLDGFIKSQIELQKSESSYPCIEDKIHSQKPLNDYKNEINKIPQEDAQKAYREAEGENCRTRQTSSQSLSYL